MNRQNYNTFLIGILTGIIIQLISFYFILFINKSLIGYNERSVFEFLDYLLSYKAGWSHVIPKLLSLAALPDLLLFFVFIWTNMLKSARGVIGSAILLGVVILILKFI